MNYISSLKQKIIEMIQREGEQWKNIIEFPIYQVSNFGNVRNTQREKELKLTVNNGGYQQVTLCRQDFKQKKLIHRLVCQYFNPNPLNYQCVDHSNANKLDNRAENLRFCTNSQNQMNKKKKNNSQSRFKGVCFNQIARKWQASIRLNGKLFHLGLFTNEQEAGRCYDRKAIELFGEFAKTNFPLEDYQQEEGQEEDQFQTGN